MSEPPQDLHQWKLPRGRHGLPPELVARSQRERLIASIVRVTAEKGYRDTSVADILSTAGVGRESFYRYFENKEDCFLAANDVLVDSLEAAMADAYAEPGEWPSRVRAGLAATLAWLAVDPAVARVMLIETGKAGAISSERFRQNLQRFIAPLQESVKVTGGSRPDLQNLPSLAAGAVFARVYEEVALGDVSHLPQLLPLLTFEVLLPYVGEASAAKERKAAERDLISLSNGN